MASVYRNRMALIGGMTDFPGRRYASQEPFRTFVVGGCTG